MDVLNCIKTRRSIRKYLDKPVPWDDVVTIVEAGKEAPTAGNLQNFKFIICVDAGKRQSLARASLDQTWMQDAPVHIVICSIPEKASMFYGIRGERLYSIQNCAAAAENMLLVAHSLGLGGCWVGAFEEELVRDICGIDVNGRPQIILTIGYPDETPPRPAKFKLVDVTFLEKWWGRVKDTGFTMAKPSVGNARRLNATKEFLGNMANNIKKHAEKIPDMVKKSEKKEE
ncbi:nitroreductase family protein [Candidatus Woesearchaeota archaeon]|nr:nitroreductase family protein [Candidatus Woesearchaeota archaeon]